MLAPAVSAPKERAVHVLKRCEIRISGWQVGVVGCGKRFGQEGRDNTGKSGGRGDWKKVGGAEAKG